MSKIAPDFTLKAGEEEIHLYFGTWTFKRLCAKWGIEYSDLVNRVWQVPDGKGVKPKQILIEDNFPDILYIAAQAYFKFNNQPITCGEDDPFLWMDQIGGFRSPQLLEVGKIFASKLVNVPPDLLSAEVEKQQAGKGAKKKNTATS